MNRKDIRIADQLRRRTNWKDAMVDPAVAVVVFRKLWDSEVINPLDGVELLVTERLRGAERGQFQAHHGGYLKVTDTDLFAGAQRELQEETGFNAVNDMWFVGTFGPTLYRSEMSLGNNDSVTLNVSTVEAEPQNAFILNIFCADVTQKARSRQTDGEVSEGIWMTPRKIIDTYGSKGRYQYSRFNYFHILAVVLRDLALLWDPIRDRPFVTPGIYRCL